MTLTLPDDFTRDLVARLAAEDRALSALYPGNPGSRQPVHTVYGGAHLFRADLARRLGTHALAAFGEYAPEPADLAAALDLDPGLAAAIHPRIVDKLRREPVEDFRIDFEDGYGVRPDLEEDGHAQSVALEVAKGMELGTLPPFVGIRIKTFSAELAARSLRTLDLFLTALLGATGGKLPQNFVVTLPKVRFPAQVAALADLFDRLEPALGLAAGALRLEIMVETTQSILDPQGQVPLRRMIEAGRGRTTGAHFGTYDYTASCDITAAYQTMDHPACDLARGLQQVALAGTGVWLSDGATNVLPVAPHRRTPDGPALLPEELAANRAAIHAAWKLHYTHVRASLANAFYQGWDLHPAQLPTRYAAVFAYFLEGLDSASARLKNFVDQAAKATLVGTVFDDAATGQGLLNYFLRALHCGALTEEEALERSGLTLEELRGRSFLKILRGRG